MFHQPDAEHPNGHVLLSGPIAQSIPAGIFTNNAVKNLTIDNTAGVTLDGPLGVSGILKVAAGNLASAGNLTLLSTATGTAVVDGSTSGTITGTVTMQRYLPSRFGYRYISSPFSNATVAQLSEEVELGADFPTVYNYDEDQVASGWVNYTSTTGVLSPLKGYAVNFGDTALSNTISISGTLNNGPVASAVLYNHNHTYTKGFHLAGNPYPSPVDWNSVAGWTKTNIDNAIYYFNNGTADRYGGTYSSYINGVSSDGVANNLIPSMQGFFIHVSNGSYPVAGGLEINNNARLTTLNPVYHKTTADETLLRLQAHPGTDTARKDRVAIYFQQESSIRYDKDAD
ncbi:MAG: hypothetical protein EOP49_49955, partial [Sphingobacteriales bacterium]